MKTGLAAEPRSSFPALARRVGRGDETTPEELRLRRREVSDKQNKNTFAESNAIFFFLSSFLKSQDRKSFLTQGINRSDYKLCEHNSSWHRW